MKMNELHESMGVTMSVPPSVILTDPQTELIEAAIILDDVQHVFRLFDCKQTKNLCTDKAWKRFRKCKHDVDEFLKPWDVTKGGRE